MPKLTKPIDGVPDGEIYPREIKAGEECPANLVEYAKGIGAIAAADKQDKGKKS